MQCVMIKIDTIGKIVTGEDAGCWLRIEDDARNTGGYLIHISRDPDFIDSHDCWVKDKSDLDRFFKECAWKVEW